MRALNLRLAAVALTAAVGLGGCAYGPMGGMSVGYGNGGYHDPYYGGYAPYGYRSAYGSPYWGMYDNYYYPGMGYYVYDRYGRPYYWSDAQRRYWEGRRDSYEGPVISADELRRRLRDFQNQQGATTQSYSPQQVQRRVVTTRQNRVIQRQQPQQPRSVERSQRELSNGSIRIKRRSRD